MTPAPASDDLSGHSLGAYRVLERLGAGGMGYVYLAEDTRLGRQVALKVLPPEMASDSERLERFEREAKAVATLNHPNIVTLHSIEEAEGIRFITMERVEGTTLSDCVPEHGLPVERLLPLAISLADALSTAHQQGITHRDLKPQNLMVTPEGRLKVLDFGLAKLHETAEPAKDSSELKTASVTQDGRILGTVAYMSPEQAQGVGVDHRSDIFSLGIVLYELATGQRPFKGGTNLSVLSSVLKDSPASITDVKQDLPKPLARMIQRCLEKNPADRYQSTSDLRRDLEDLKRDIETGEVLSSGASHPSLPGVRAPGARPLLLAAAALILALMGAAWFLVSTPSSTPEAAPADPRPSIAVFYFENVTGDPELDWLRNGLTDMLVTDLSQSPGLRVLTTAQLHQILADMGTLDLPTVTLDMIQAVAREAQVNTALVGSFVKAGDRIRIQAQLQDTASGEVVAAERVEGPGEASLFSLVDDLTKRIKARLEVTTVARAEANVDRNLEDVTTASVEAYRHYAEGMRLHEQFREREALPFLEKAVEADPEFAMALAKLSVLHGNLGDFQKSFDYGRQALERVDRLTARERYYIEGLHYARQTDTVEESIEAYTKAVELYPDHTAARTNLATQLLRLERYEDAIGHLEALRRLRAPFPLPYKSLADAYAIQGDFEKGFVVLQEYVADHPNTAAAHTYLGNFLTRWGKYDSALEAFATAERLEGDLGEIEAGRWAAHMLAGQRAEAEASAVRILTLDGPKARLQGYGFKLAMGLLDGQLRETLAIGELLVDGSAGLGPMQPIARIYGATLLGDVGRPDEAVELLRPALDAELPDPLWAAGANAQMALLEARRGNLEASQSFLEQAREEIEDTPSRIRDRWEAQSRGAVLLARGDFAAAVQALKRAAELSPKHGFEEEQGLPQLWFDLAKAYLETGQDTEAEPWLRRLAEAGVERLQAPIQHVRSLYLLAELLERRGQTQEARDLYQRFLDHWGDGEIDRERVELARGRLSALETATR